MAGLNIIRPQRRAVTVNDLPQNVLNVGLTGGIGSGKSTVAKLLTAYGWAVLDLDAIARELTAAGGAALPQIKTTFGAQMITADGALDRARMREQAFQDPTARQALEAILHPMIQTATLHRAHRFAQSSQTTGRLRGLVYDIPLLTEGSYWKTCLDWIVVVNCTRAVQLARVQQRNPHLNLPTIMRMMDAQASPAEREKIANVLIDNEKNDSKCLHLHPQIDILTNHRVVTMV